MFMWTIFTWPEGPSEESVRLERLRDIEGRMNAYLLEKQGEACADVIDKVQTARDHVRSETDSQRVAF